MRGGFPVLKLQAQSYIHFFHPHLTTITTFIIENLRSLSLSITLPFSFHHIILHGLRVAVSDVPVVSAIEQPHPQDARLVAWMYPGWGWG